MNCTPDELIDWRRNRISMVFQRFGLFPHKTVMQNVGYGLEMQGKSEEDRDKVAMEKIDAVGLNGFENQFPNQLSGGMQQRVGLARALATNSDIMLMDEAFSALDPLIRSDMQKQLIDLQSELKKTIVFITHDLDESLRLGDHIGILNAGKLVQVGTPVDIIMNPADDYVKAFVKDVNRAKVIKAKIIMTNANETNGIDKSNLVKVNEDQFIEEFLPQIVCTNANCEVVDKSGNIKGYITIKGSQVGISRPEFEYEIACTEICGRGHFSMKKVIEVVEPAEYQKWLAEQKSFLQQNPSLAEGLKTEKKEIAGIN